MATALTGLGCSFLPLPDGRSGCVSTASMVWPAAISADRCAAEKSGVPAKQSLSPDISSGRLLVFFFQLLAYALALQRAEVVNEQLALEVVNFMLDTYG